MKLIFEQDGKDAYTTGEAARKLHVSLGTLVEWEKKAFIECWRTTKGHRRFSANEVKRLFYEIYREGGTDHENSKYF